MLTYGSVCSGIESASIAWEPIGLSPLWLSEIEPFPSAVLAHHWPQVPNLGDMTKLAHHIRVGAIPAPDILVGGTPCQAFSVAGVRKGLEDERGQLTIHYGDIANAIDEQRGKGDECVVVWENVPGVLSSKDNAFGCFLGLLAGEAMPLEPPGKKWTNAGCVYGPQRTVAWRILDAQHFGVAQRRRRVFVVASARDGFDPTKVLFEFEGVRRDIAPSRETGKDLAKCLRARANLSHREDSDTLVFGGYVTDETASTMKARDYKDATDLVTGVLGNISHCLLGEGFDASEDGTGRGTPIITLPIHDKTTRHAGKTGIGSGNGLGVGKEEEDPMFTLTTGDKHVVCVHGTQDPCVSKELAFSLGCNNGGENAVFPAVRRLTPIECERLQGFPDNHTRIPWRNKPFKDCPDGPRYKAIGNSKAVPVIRFVGLQVIKEWFRC